MQDRKPKRLNIRLLRSEDFNSWVELFKANNIAKYLDLDPKLSEYELCQWWFGKAFYRYKNDLVGMNALIDKKTKRLISQCGLLIQTIQRLEICYSDLPGFWIQGFASESAVKCKDHAFENNFANSLISLVHIDIISSEKVGLTILD